MRFYNMCTDELDDVINTIKSMQTLMTQKEIKIILKWRKRPFNSKLNNKVDRILLKYIEAL